MGRNAALDAQLDECRELLSEVRGATKDLRQLLRECQDAYTDLAKQTLAPLIETEAEKISTAATAAIAQYEEHLARRFTKFVNVLTTGRRSGHTNGHHRILTEILEEATLPSPGEQPDPGSAFHSERPGECQVWALTRSGTSQEFGP